MRAENDMNLDPRGSSENQGELSAEQEEKLLKSAKELFLNQFPNPERKGCADSETIKAMAFGKLRGETASGWWSHFATCSPCTREFSGFQQKARSSRNARIVVGIAASILFTVGIVAWLAIQGRGGPEPFPQYEPSTLDLRGMSLVRGGSTSSNSPLELPRRRLALSIFLPTGTEPGEFDVQVSQQPENPILTASGPAILRDQIAVLDVRLDLTGLTPGSYLLAIRERDWDWNYYRVTVR
jgi:hypothetical protein